MLTPTGSGREVPECLPPEGVSRHDASQWQKPTRHPSQNVSRLKACGELMLTSSSSLTTATAGRGPRVSPACRRIGTEQFSAEGFAVTMSRTSPARRRIETAKDPLFGSASPRSQKRSRVKAYRDSSTAERNHRHAPAPGAVDVASTPTSGALGPDRLPPEDPWNTDRRSDVARISR